MIWKDKNFITLEDLGFAYRKAKADLYYERGHANSFALCEYEENLYENLNNLYHRLHERSLVWMASPEIIGGWSVIPKKIKGFSDTDIIFSNPDVAWERIKPKNNDKASAEFRLIGLNSIDFHVVAALWVIKVGYIYDQILDQDAYASRLRRKGNDNSNEQINPFSLGTYKPYYGPYKKWRDNGLKAIDDALERDKNIIAITSDITLFYHSLNPGFLLDDNYLELTGLNKHLNEDQIRFTKAFIRALHAWTNSTPIGQKNKNVGLPVGFPSCKLIANVSLANFDKSIKQELTPIYYGRYVDDILLVFENTHDLICEKDIRNYLLKKINPLLKEENNNFYIDLPYNLNGQLEFQRDKQKIFILDGKNGKTLIKSIEWQINSRASEWRSLPDIPNDADTFTADVVKCCTKDGGDVDNLRKADSLSIRRANFSLKLRDIEAFEKDLPNNVWKEHRLIFLKAVKKHICSLPQFFDFYVYIPRIIGLAIACRDYEISSSLLERLNELISMIEDDCDSSIAGSYDCSENIVDLWRECLFKSLYETVSASWNTSSERDNKSSDGFIDTLNKLPPTNYLDFVTEKEIIEWSNNLFIHDLGRKPFREKYLPNHKQRITKTKKKSYLSRQSISILNSNLVENVTTFLKEHSFQNFKKKLNTPRLPLALLFPTRPFTVSELYAVIPNLLFHEANDNNPICTWASAFRGFKPQNSPPGLITSLSNDLIADSPRISVSNIHLNNPIKIAVTCWETREESWVASASNNRDPDLLRYLRLNKLINEIILAFNRPDYVIMPELSLPIRWFWRISYKLAQRGISFISGVEYIHHSTDCVANQVWALLVSDFLGMRTGVLYRQDKIHPAIHEEHNLHDIAGNELSPLFNDDVPKKPIIEHENFIFGFLICSELTNIEYRSNFRGKVDAVFVPEWNRDIDSFSSLVESSSMDIHAYIVQCNDRKYGDSRIRCPARNVWERDILRVKGGIEDYFVIGEIDVLALRRFQSRHRSNENGPFKPVPDGFVIDERRRELPS